MCMVSFSVPEEILLDLHEDKIDFTNYIKKTIAFDLYKERNVSLGYCASVADMTKEDFIQYLGANQISIFEFASESEFTEEASNA